MVFHWHLSDSKSLQISRTLLSILADLNNAVVWMVLICPPITNFLSKLSGRIPSMLITIGITIIFIFHRSFSSQAKSTYLPLSAKMAKSTTIIIIIYSSRVFHISISWWFLLEFEWQQVSSSLQDSSQYSGHPQQCCHLDSLYPSANFHYYYYYYMRCIKSISNFFYKPLFPSLFHVYIWSLWLHCMVQYKLIISLDFTL